MTGESKQISVHQYANGAFIAQCKLMAFGETQKTQHRLSAKTIEQIFQLLASVTIPVFASHEMGQNGGFTELEVGGYGGGASFRWWSCPPQQWQSLDQATNKIIDLCGFDDAIFS
jgi:hypothetical protein